MELLNSTLRNYDVFYKLYNDTITKTACDLYTTRDVYNTILLYKAFQVYILSDNIKIKTKCTDMYDDVQQNAIFIETKYCDINICSINNIVYMTIENLDASIHNVDELFQTSMYYNNIKFEHLKDKDETRTLITKKVYKINEEINIYTAAKIGVAFNSIIY